jgi:hypothetical protein
LEAGFIDMSISIATNGKFVGPPTRTAIFTRSGGDAGGPILIDVKKPIVRVTKVKYDKKKKNINIFIKEIKDDKYKH